MIKAKKENEIKGFLENIDVLVEGRYVDKLHTEVYKYRGSSNQRIIDVVSSLKTNKLVLIKKFDPV
jgi:anaerobic ribonucleoside-triphosphate reductase activating protein